MALFSHSHPSLSRMPCLLAHTRTRTHPLALCFCFFVVRMPCYLRSEDMDRSFFSGFPEAVLCAQTLHENTNNNKHEYTKY